MIKWALLFKDSSEAASPKRCCQGGTKPITADVTALYVTNAGTVDSKFKLRVLIT